ncbi:MAG TPA: BON domain-containing protein [Bryobacteraceae bacterium]|nr:BON domain-containing protein [Bryobacteraceae bacterium]
MGGDTQLKRHVEDELSWQPSVDQAAIGVSVKNAIVTLTGPVRSYAEKLAAEHAVMRIHGVKALASELQVSLPGAHERVDEDIARAAVNVLGWSASVPKDAIKVKVAKGWVTLAGTVDWAFQKHDAEREVSHLIGVKGVTNEVGIKPAPVPVSSTIKTGIEAALKRSAEVEARRIHVETTGRTVTLTGSVASWPERRAAERAAWAAPGVANVENRLLVSASMAAAGWEGPGVL